MSGEKESKRGGARPGAGRPRKDPIPPAPDPEKDPEDKKLEDARDELLSMKLTASTCREVAQPLGDAIAAGYGVIARVLDDDRWRLAPEEISVQKSLVAVTLLIFGDRIPIIGVGLMLGLGFAAPVIARSALPPKEKSNMGAPIAREKKDRG